MKTYEEYVQMLTVALEEQSSSRGLCFRKSFANNQISLDAVCLKGEKISPVLYMQSYYEQFCSGTAVEDIARQMLQLLYTAPTNHIEGETKRLLSYAVVPKWIDGEHQEYEYLSAAYLSALNVADVMECETIAFPLLAAGNNGFDLGLAYEIAKTSIESFEGNNLKSAILVVYGDTVATFLKGKGVYVENAKEFDKIHAVEDSTQLQVVQVKSAGKQIAKQILLEQMAKAVKYLENPKNREKVVIEDAVGNSYSMTIKDGFLKHWNTTEEELFDKAMKNATEQNEYTTHTYLEVLSGAIEPDDEWEELKVPLITC